MKQKKYYKIVSGRTDRQTACLYRLLLRPAGLIYVAVIKQRNWLYSAGWLKSHRANAVVISIGNITVGGTGKTPLVIWLCSLLAKRNIRCAVLTRGYKAVQDSKLRTQNYTDEVAVITENCPDAKVIVNPDRVAGAGEAVEKYDAQVLVLDDGFQHRRLARDIDIVAIDATRPFGYDRVLPAGLLREPVGSLRRADAIVITRSDQVDYGKLNELESELHRLSPHATIAQSIHAPTYLRYADSRRLNPVELKNKKIFSFCGIANPNAFFDTIRNTGGNIAGSSALDDHYQYSEDCVVQIYDRAKNCDAEIILTTEKDWTKIAAFKTINRAIPFAYLAVEIKFCEGEDKLIALIESALTGKIRPMMGPGKIVRNTLKA